jgi:hypothetical protein
VTFEEDVFAKCKSSETLQKLMDFEQSWSPSTAKEQKQLNNEQKATNNVHLLTNTHHFDIITTHATATGSKSDPSSFKYGATTATPHVPFVPTNLGDGVKPANPTFLQKLKAWQNRHFISASIDYPHFCAVLFVLTSV